MDIISGNVAPAPIVEIEVYPLFMHCAPCSARHTHPPTHTYKHTCISLHCVFQSDRLFHSRRSLVVFEM